MCDPSPARALGQALLARQWHVAVAESLTGGLLSLRLVQAVGASEWLRGGVVAYDPAVKHEVLGVRSRLVITEEAARELAEGVAVRLGADLGLATTGVAGPAEAEGQPCGTVWIGVWTRLGDPQSAAYLHHFDGSPDEVREAAVATAIGHGIDHLKRL